MPLLTIKTPTKTTTVHVERGTSLHDVLAREGLLPPSPCGGRGRCGKCIVQVVGGEPGEPSPAEADLLTFAQLAAGYRLACQVTAHSDLSVSLTEEAAYTAKGALSGAVRAEVDPWVKKRALDASSEEIPLRERLLSGLPGVRVPLRVLRELARLRDGLVTATFAGGEVLRVEAGDTTSRLLGVAVDIGTTSVVVSLLDLVQGLQLAIAADENPQAVYGADVISRITHCLENPAGVEELRRRVVRAVNELVARVTGEAGANPRDVMAAVLVGNTTMQHLFLGLDPSRLSHKPFTAVTLDEVETGAAEAGLELNPAARVVFLPLIAGYVGADTVGAVLASGMHRASRPRLLVDIGTNGEIVIGCRDRLLACSTAAGPAFEGERISCGMRGVDGAIGRVYYDGSDLRIETIGDVKPRGLCGSGLVDAVATLLRLGLVDSTGRLRVGERAPDRLSAALRSRLGQDEVVLAQGVTLTQKDIRELQLAKSAIASGVLLLMEEYGIEGDDLEEIMLAGTFGNYIDVSSAVIIGLLPGVPEEKVRPIGNAAHRGAVMALMSRRLRSEARGIARAVEHVELSAHPRFQQSFVANIAFPPGGGGSA